MRHAEHVKSGSRATHRLGRAELDLSTLCAQWLPGRASRAASWSAHRLVLNPAVVFISQSTHPLPPSPATLSRPPSPATLSRRPPHDSLGCVHSAKGKRVFVQCMRAVSFHVFSRPVAPCRPGPAALGRADPVKMPDRRLDGFVDPLCQKAPHVDPPTNVRPSLVRARRATGGRRTKVGVKVLMLDVLGVLVVHLVRSARAPLLRFPCLRATRETRRIE